MNVNLVLFCFLSTFSSEVLPVTHASVINFSSHTLAPIRRVPESWLVYMSSRTLTRPHSPTTGALEVSSAHTHGSR